MGSPHGPICLLFDIDGTLVEAGGAGRAAVERACAEVTGAPGAMEGVPFSGRTDRWIMAEAGRRAGVRIDRAAFVPRYLAILEQELAARRPRPLRGVAALLGRLAARGDVALAVCTGNMRAGAFAKLRRAGLGGYFADGGFGDDHEERADVTRDAARAAGWTPGAPLAHVGDTEHDVRAAHAAGAAAVGVATGPIGPDALRAAGADLVLPDLAGGERTIAALLGAARGAAAAAADGPRA